MDNIKNSTEIYESKDGSARFYIAYSSKEFSTGLMVLQSRTSLPKHNRPLATENLTQISGKCLVKIFDENDNAKDYELNPGEGVTMPKGQFHIHSNPHKEISITLWMVEGDIVEIIEAIRKTNKKISTNIPKNL